MCYKLVSADDAYWRVYAYIEVDIYWGGYILGWIYIGLDIYVGVTEKVIGCIPGPSQVTHLIQPGQRTFRLQCEFKKCQEDTLRNGVMKIHSGEGID